MMGPIVSNALRLEPLVAAHADEMFAPLSAIAIYDYIPERPPLSLVALRERYVRLERGRSPDGRQQWLNWIVRLASGRCAGFVQSTIHPERTADFAFAFAPEYWGKGIAFEACEAALPYLFGALRVTALFATVDPRNARSLRLLLRLGFDEVAAAAYPHGEVEPADRVFACTSTPLSPEPPRP
jgi:RimJ/RimL family protein N-acetyltransferase